mgnify:CR=1 FL=1
MAHADYDCCAICDCKMQYNEFDSLTKERICEPCLIKLRVNGVMVITFDELIKWVNDTDKEFAGWISFRWPCITMAGRTGAGAIRVGAAAC